MKQEAHSLDDRKNEGHQLQESDVHEEIDLEQWCKQGHDSVPRARRYRVKIDRDKYVVTVSKLTGLELLKLVGKSPETHKLYFKPRREKPVRISPEETISLLRPGVERFQTIPCDAQEGQQKMRRQFDLMMEDLKALEERAFIWETIIEGNANWLLTHQYTIPDGYNHPKVIAAFRYPPQYPDVQIDMVYFFPALKRADGKDIGGVSDIQLDKKLFQQWSRHRTSHNPWCPGLDNLATHLLMVDDWLERECN